jgi:putative FmdB family regulatory protein
MPIYDYLCPNGHRFEVIHALSGPAPDSCPVCGAAPVRKAFSAPSIHFKGSGWAKKDRSASSRPAASASTDEGSTGAPGDKVAATDASAGTATEKATSSTGAKETKASTESGESKTPKGSTASGTAAAD